MIATVAAPVEESTRPATPGQALSWVAVVGSPDPEERIDRLPARRTVVAPSGSAAGLTLLGVGGLPLPYSAVGPPGLDSCGAIFEGQLYDRDELRTRLEIGAGPALTDAELVVRAYLRWGEAMFERLKGLFAFVVWDGRAQRVLAARDRMGIFPLFHADTGRERLFATSPALLTLHPRVSRRLDRAVMAERLCYRFHDARETDYAAIARLPPGHYGSWSEREERLARYWQPVPESPTAWIRDDVPARVDALFRRAVSRCLELGPAGIFLSGGLDSINVAALATDLCRESGTRPPLALSIAFPDTLSEAAVQSGVARQLGLEHRLRPFAEISGGERALVALTELSPEFPLPLLSEWKTAYLALALEGAESGCRSILTGMGGDEWMDMGMRFTADLLRAGDLRGLYAHWRTLDRCYPTGGRRLARFVLWRYGARPLVVSATLSVLGPLGRRWQQASKRRYVERSTPFWLAPDPSLRQQLDERAERHLPDPPRRDFMNEHTRECLDSSQHALQMEEQYESARRAGVRVLAPLVDSDLIELLLRVPRDILHRGGMTKALLREPAVRRFPDLGFDRQRKLGATPFARSFVQEQAGATLAALGGLKRLDELAIVDAARFERWALEDLRRERSLDYIRIWNSLSLESWTRSKV